MYTHTQTQIKKLQERSCPLCMNTTYTVFAQERIDTHKINYFTYSSRKEPEFMCLRLVRCTDCDLIYAPTPPTQDFLSKVYFEADYDSIRDAQSAAISYAKVLTPYIKRLTKKNAAVDVGAGSGPLLPLLSKFGFRSVIGIEPSRAAIEAAAPETRSMLREGMFTAEMIADVKPSLMCSFMILEHLDNPSEFIQTAYTLLEPGGMVAIVVHNWRAPLNRLLGLHSPIIDIEHLQLFSPQSLTALLTRNGFESIQLESITNSYSLQYWLRLMPLPMRVKQFMQKILKYTKIENKNITLSVGNIFAVATKPV